MSKCKCICHLEGTPRESKTATATHQEHDCSCYKEAREALKKIQKQQVEEIMKYGFTKKQAEYLAWLEDELENKQESYD